MFLVYLAIVITSFSISSIYSMEQELYDPYKFSVEIIHSVASRNDIEALAKIATSLKLHPNHFCTVLDAYNFNIKKNGYSEDLFSHANQALSICLKATPEIPVDWIDADSLTFLNTMTAYIRNTYILRQVLTAIEKYYTHDIRSIELQYGKAHKAAIHVCASIEAK